MDSFTPKKYRLSFCDIIQISDDIFEVFVDEAINVDAECAKEEFAFWDRIRSTPFSVLLNCTTSFSYDFEGARKIGKSPNQRRIAVLIYNNLQYHSNSMAIVINKVQFPDKSAMIFNNRAAALEWLEERE